MGFRAPETVSWLQKVQFSVPIAIGRTFVLKIPPIANLQNVIANGNAAATLKSMGLTDFKKELNKFDKDKLINIIADLYKRNKSVKEFFDFYVNPNEKELFEKYRSKVFEAFYPKRGYDFKLKDGKKAISDFKKPGASADLIADLMLFYVETGVKFTNDFGDNSIYLRLPDWTS